MRIKTKLFSLILALMLIVVSVPVSVVSEEMTKEQGDLSIAETSNEAVEQQTTEFVTDFQDDFITEQITLQEHINDVEATATSTQYQLVTDIPDGIYAIESTNISMCYMFYDTAETNYSWEIGYQLYSLMSPTLMGMPAFLFKITRVPDTDRYIIRLMSNLNLTLYITSTCSSIKEIPIDDSQVLEDDTFNIIYDNGAYLISPVGSSQYICAGNNSYLTTKEYDNLPYMSHWRFRGYRSYIEDGTYSFKNLGNSGMWASTQNDSYEAGANIKQKAYSTNPIDTFSRDGMFKINRIGDTYLYTIRSMTNNLLAWSAESSTIVTQDIPPSESDIPNSMKFYIAYDAGAYIIIPYSLYTVVGASSSGEDLITVSQNNAPNTAKWKLYKYMGQPQYGIDIVDGEDFISNGAVVGQTYDFEAVFWSTDLNIHDYFLALPSQYNNAATLNWNSAEKTASFTATEFLDIGINVGCYTATNGYTTIYIKDPIVFNTISQEETVYIQNKGSEKYVSSAGALISGGGDVGQYTYSDSSDLQWIIERDSNNTQYVRFKSLSNGKYLGVDTSNQTHIRQYSSKGDNTLWKIVSTGSGSSQIICKAYESSGKSLSIPTQSMMEGDPLMCYEYTDDDDYSDEWNIVTQVLSYVNYYDTSIAGDTSKILNISVANSFANSVYSRYFGIGMHRDGNPTYYHTTADDCPLGNAACTSEACGENCYQSHHKNVDAIYDQLYNSDREDDHIYVLWTDRGNTYCEGTSANHISTEQTLAFVRGYEPIIQFLVIYDPPPDLLEEAFMGINLVHETAHTFNMIEVNTNPSHDVNEASICVMEQYEKDYAIQFYQDIKNGYASPFCDSCMAKMLEYTSNINIMGNQGGN